jgi:hypothetical protein
MGRTQDTDESYLKIGTKIEDTSISPLKSVRPLSQLEIGTKRFGSAINFPYTIANFVFWGKVLSFSPLFSSEIPALRFSVLSCVQRYEAVRAGCYSDLARASTITVLYVDFRNMLNLGITVF